MRNMRKATGTFIFTRLLYENFQMNNWFSVALIRKAVLINLTHSFFFLQAVDLNY